MYNNHFKKEYIDSFEIDGGKFEYRATTAGQENDWLSQYLVERLVTDPETNEQKVQFKQDFGKLNKLRICNNLITVPYSQAEIKERIGIEKDWIMLNPEEKWDLISLLDPKILSKIIENIAKIEAGSDDQKN